MPDANQKHFCFLQLFKGAFTSFCKNKKVIKMSQNSKKRFFLIFCLMKEGSGSVQIMVGSGELQKHPDPDWNKLFFFIRERGDPEECACSTRRRRWSTPPRRWSGTFSSPSRQAPRAGQAKEKKISKSKVLMTKKWFLFFYLFFL